MRANRIGRKAGRQEDARYHRTEMKKEIIIQKMKEQGCRITRQRRILLDVILEEECSCCKEIYYRASRQDESIGSATVYRMIHTLEEIGAISRKNMYRISCEETEARETRRIEFADGSCLELSSQEWDRVIASGLKACGYFNVGAPMKICVGGDYVQGSV